jgi:hypothetical protein
VEFKIGLAIMLFIHILQGAVEMFFKGYVIKHIFTFAKSESFQKKMLAKVIISLFGKKNMFFSFPP